MPRAADHASISVVIPIFDEERTLPELVRRLAEVLTATGLPYELLFVNDGSRDRSLDILRELGRDDPRVKVLCLSRNFGHQVAITAGLDHARGDAVVIMDGYLQDPPEVIPRLLEKWRAGFDVVYAVRTARAGETRFKRATAKLFYRFFARLSQLDVPVDVGDFRLLSRRAADHLRGFRETNRYVRGLSSWIGLRQVGISYTRDPRFAGDTKYGFTRMMRLGLDGVSSFSSAPLQASFYVGLLVAMACGLYIAWSLYVRFVQHTTVRGWTSTVVIMLLLFAVQFVILGIYGEYIGRIYAEVKRRPLYIVEEQLNLDTPAGEVVAEPGRETTRHRAG